jgi:hypothetical protein
MAIYNVNLEFTTANGFDRLVDDIHSEIIDRLPTDYDITVNNLKDLGNAHKAEISTNSIKELWDFIFIYCGEDKSETDDIMNQIIDDFRI